VLLADQLATAQDTLGGAAVLSDSLPADVAATVMAAAREAFVHGMHVTSALAGASAIVLAGLAVATLRHLRKPSDDASASGDNTESQGTAPTAVPATELAA
jgi:hypothetical protein